MPPEVWNVVWQQREDDIAKRPVGQSCVRYKSRRQPCYGQKRPDHYPIPPYQYHCAFIEKRSESSSTTTSPQRRQGQLNGAAWAT